MYPSQSAAVLAPVRIPWINGKLAGQKRPLELREIRTVRIHLQMARRSHDLALFNLAIDRSSIPVSVSTAFGLIPLPQLPALCSASWPR